MYDLELSDEKLGIELKTDLIFLKDTSRLFFTGEEKENAGLKNEKALAAFTEFLKATDIGKDLYSITICNNGNTLVRFGKTVSIEEYIISGCGNDVIFNIIRCCIKYTKRKIKCNMYDMMTSEFCDLFMREATFYNIHAGMAYSEVKEKLNHREFGNQKVFLKILQATSSCIGMPPFYKYAYCMLNEEEEDEFVHLLLKCLAAYGYIYYGTPEDELKRQLPEQYAKIMSPKSRTNMLNNMDNEQRKAFRKYSLEEGLKKKEGRDYFLCDYCDKYYYKSQMGCISGMEVMVVADKDNKPEELMYPHVVLNSNRKYGTETLCKRCGSSLMIR